MENVSFKIPAYLSNFSSLDNGRTVAKLKMFYVGKTADNREFTKDFAESLVTSLPYCPVVAYYSDVTKDFIGHNSKQYIYGVVTVDNDAHFEFDDNGTEWFITNVMLYTDRIDNIGEVANKIVGHAQSLEMDPSKTEYESFVDEKGHRGVRFTKGSLIGLSVLGADQQPAFTGSEFFEATEFSDMREKFENFFSYLEEKSRGKQMEKEQFTTLANFYRLSYTDKMKMADQLLNESLGDNFASCIVDMDDNTITAEIFSYETLSSIFKRFAYSLDEGGLSLGNSEEVFQKLLTAEEIKFLEEKDEEKPSSEESDSDKEKDEEKLEKNEEISDKKDPEDEKKESEDEMVSKEEDKKDCPAENKEECPEKDKCPEHKEDCQVESKEEDKKDCPEEKEDKKEKDEEDAPSKEGEEDKYSSNTSALSDSERNELENYRKQARIDMVNSYNEMLPQDILDSFMNKIEEYDNAKLEVELALEFSKYSKTHKGQNSNENVPLSFSKIINSEKATDDDDSYEGLVRKLLNK